MPEDAIGRADDAADAVSQGKTSARSIGAALGAHTRRVDLFDWRKVIASSGLTSTQKLVAWTLSLHMDRGGGSCYPAIATVAREASLRDRAVQSAIVALEGGGVPSTRRRRRPRSKLAVLRDAA